MGSLESDLYVELSAPTVSEAPDEIAILLRNAKGSALKNVDTLGLVLPRTEDSCSIGGELLGRARGATCSEPHHKDEEESKEPPPVLGAEGVKSGLEHGVRVQLGTSFRTGEPAELM